MDLSAVSTSLITVLLVFVILGFICGWVRGLNKSILRFFMVLAVGVLAFFVVPAISKAILTMDISKMNIMIGDVHVITVQELITDLLRQVPIIEDLIESSDTLASFIQLLPQMIVNVAFFVVCFFIFKWLSLIFYWIFAAIFFSKKKRAGKDKHGFMGAIVGALQGLVVACIIFVPTFGIVETAKPFVAYNTVTQSTESGEASKSVYNNGVYNIDSTIEDGENDGKVENKPNNAFDKASYDETVEMIDEFIKAYENNWVYKMFNAIGLKKLDVSMFDGLTTVKNNTLEFKLRRETTAVAKVVPNVLDVMEKGVDITDNQTLATLEKVIDDLYESKAVSGMVKEIVPYVAEKWSNDAEFCGFKKPTFKDAAMQETFDAMLVSLSTAQGDTVKNDLSTGIGLLKICNDAGLTKALVDNGDIIAIFQKEGNESLISNVIGKALESKTLKDVLPEIVDLAMGYVYTELGINVENIPERNKDLAINWEGDSMTRGEKAILQSLFNNVLKLSDQIDGITLETLDFALVGSTFDDLRDSVLLSNASKIVMNKLFDDFAGDTANAELFNIMKTKIDAVWDSKEVRLSTTFKSIGDAVILAKDLTSADGFNKDKIGDILENFATNGEQMKELVTEVVKTENLEKLGLDNKIAGFVNEVITSVISQEGEALKTEINAVKEVMVVANNVLSTGAGDIDDDNAQIIVDALAKSNVLLNTITSDTSAISDLDIANSLSENSKASLAKAVAGLSGEQSEVANKLNKLFGLSA